MIKKTALAVMAVCVCLVASAQEESDSLTLDDLDIPYVEKNYVQNTTFKDNWFFSLYGGYAFNRGSNTSHAPFFKVGGPAAAFVFGKETTPISTVRLQLNYVRNSGVTDNQFGVRDGVDYSWMNYNLYTWNSYALNFDYLLNLTNLIFGFKENRLFNFQTVIGIGGSVSRGYTTDKFAQAQGYDNDKGSQLNIMDKYDSRQRSLINIRVGAALTIQLSRRWNFNVEVVGNVLDNSYDSNPQTENVWDMHFDALAGLTYRFRNEDGRASGFYYPKHDINEYAKRVADINDLRAKTRQRKDDLNSMADTIDVDANVLYTLIAFDEGDDEIDRLQQTNIYTTAYAWAKSPKSVICIVNSTGVNDKLFRRRAEAVTDALVERYEIPIEAIMVVAKESDIRVRGDYIEMIIND